jgi:L-fucose isomerase-like protein
MKQPTLGVIVGNRGFFPAHLCKTGREEILRVLGGEGITAVALDPAATEFGSVESLEDATKCAELFKKHRDEIDGVLVALPNFGDERAVANTLRMAGLNVPVLIQAFPDDPDKMDVANRRDSFCGKMSACNNLSQYGILYSLTSLHTVAPASESFRRDLRRFVSICQVVNGLRNARFGAIGARPAPFLTVRFSEKLLERAGISVTTLDLSEVFGKTELLSDDDPGVRRKREEIEAYVPTKGVPVGALNKMAKFGFVIQEWMAENRLQASAIQCWTSMEEYFGITPCTLMSMMSNSLLPSACETDIAGAVGMYALRLASGKPSALVDWNNNYGDDPNKGVLFHCSNWPKQLFEETPVMSYQDIIAQTVGQEKSYGVVVGRAKSQPFTFCRVSTDDTRGVITSYVGEGQLTDDPIKTFGGYAVVQIEDFQGLLRYICEMGFEHHVAINPSETAAVVEEALGKYLGWEVYNHGCNSSCEET